jgi:site-specific recombinase XerD
VPGSAYAFANPKTGKPYKHIFTAWDTARKKAGLSDLRIHDLRHSFASALINSGRSLYEVQKILGHTQVKTTQRYSHLSQESLVAAANTASPVVPLARLAHTTSPSVTLDPGALIVAA